MAAVPKTAKSKRYVLALGTVEWYNTDGELHRIDGPAIERYVGDQEWFLNNKRHRLDGPAVEWTNGTRLYLVNHQLVDEAEFPAAVAAYCKSHPACPSVVYPMAGRLTKPSAISITQLYGHTHTHTHANKSRWLLCPKLQNQNAELTLWVRCGL